MLETLNSFSDFYFSNILIRLLLAPTLLVLLGYLIFRRREEFGEGALKNTLATLGLTGFNIAALWTFGEEVNSAAQAAYNALGIPKLPSDFWANAPLWLICILGIVAKDFADYWNHRAMHMTWLWPTHAAHHSDTHVNAFTTFRVHFLESFVMSFSYILLLTWLQMPAAIPFVVMFHHLHNLYVHMNIPVDHGPFRLLLASPVFHRWHHADTPLAYGKNLANVIPAWDAIFGTYYCPGECKYPMGAKKSGIEDVNPLLIFIYPFQEWARLIRKTLRRTTRDQSHSAKPDPANT